jgi:hypothetical protein
MSGGGSGGMRTSYSLPIVLTLTAFVLKSRSKGAFCESVAL